jgi:hypothetical protein
MAKHIAQGTATQVAHPWKSVFRTFVAAAVGVGVAWLVRTLGIDLTALSQPIIDSLTAGAWAGAMGLVQWLLTRPKLQGFWAAIGLGTGVENEPETIDGEFIADGPFEGFPVADPHEPTTSPDRDQQ